MIAEILNFRTKSVAFAALLLGFSFLGSRLLGILRNRLLAGKLGAGEDFDTYVAAFRIPDFLFGVLVIGGISAVFLPIFSEYVEKDRNEAWEFASTLLNVLGILLVIMAGVLFFAAPFLIHVIAPGFSGEQKETLLSLTRVMLFSPILFGLSSVFSGVLQYFNRFFVYALAPIVYSIGIIIGILFFLPRFGVLGLAVGVVVGAGLHLLIQMPAVFASGFHWRFSINFFHPGVLRAIRLALPRTLGAASFHLNVIVMTAFASLLSAGSLAMYTLADDLHSVPVSLVGASFALACFPVLSRFSAKHDAPAFQQAFSLAFREILFITVPFFLLLLLLRNHLIDLLYRTGEFGSLEVQLTGAMLGIFTFGIVFQAVIPLLVRAFFALHDTKTPTCIGLGAVGVNIILVSSFLWGLSFENSFSATVFSVLGFDGEVDARVVALPCALVLFWLLQVVFLCFFLSKKVPGIFGKELLVSIQKMVVSCVALIGGVLGTLYVARIFLRNDTPLGNLSETLGAIGIGAIAYLMSSLLLKSPELLDLKNSFGKQFHFHGGTHS